MAFLDLAGGLPRTAFDRLRPLLHGKPRNVLIAGTALAAAMIITLVLWSSAANYSALFAGLSGEEGGRAIAELQKLNLPYRIADGGRVILVPQADVGFARLQLAARGIPKQDGDQWALLDNESLGVSPFVEQVHYTRAVETALARTIRDVDGVVSATVKLALPKESDFLADTPKPSAAVMVRLRPGVQLTAAQIDGLVGLVAAGAPGLTRDNVTLVDQTGRVLNSNGKDGLQQIPEQLEIARQVARQYEGEVTDLLVPVLGRGNFRVSADADIDFAHWQESSVKYGDSHVLSQDEAIHSHAANAESPIGIPGALSNRPPDTPTVSATPPAAQASPAPPAPVPTAANAPARPEASPPPPDTHRTTNYDIDRTVQSLEHPSWRLRAINIDVLINNPSRNPIPAARLQSIDKLVSSAIGAGENHHVTVVDLPFADQGSAVGEVNPPWWRQNWMGNVTQNALLVLAGLLVLIGGVLPLLRHMRVNLAATAQLNSRRARHSANTENDGKAEPAISSLAGTRHALVVDIDTVRALVANDPARTAQVIKEWIGRDRSGISRTG
ncbi:MAG: flagellar M-ring protein FliF [Alphaproteobacteria bacterium]|nr:flagellar M-ring protein FliF [Alphaproteobacteria bacterium]